MREVEVGVEPEFLQRLAETYHHEISVCSRDLSRYLCCLVAVGRAHNGESRNPSRQGVGCALCNARAPAVEENAPLPIRRQGKYSNNEVCSVEVFGKVTASQSSREFHSDPVI